MTITGRLLAISTLFLLWNPRIVPAQEQYSDPTLTAEERGHWSFVPPQRAPIPQSNAAATANPIDAFIQAELAKHKLTPAPEADRRTLIRRLTFDLTGLPPTAKEVEQFVKDTSPQAYEQLVDRLLASPHYGERWAQHWLDVVRFAESNGYEADGERPHAWRYRDYVVSHMNADTPYDVFVREQVAGDLLAAGQNEADATRLRIATGMHRCGPAHMVGGNTDPAELRQETLTEMVNGLGSAVLGLTIACARCHDHKFDPISLGDYYRLQAFFEEAKYKDHAIATDAERQAYKTQSAAVSKKLAPLNSRLSALEAPYHAQVLAEKKAKLSPEARAAVDTPAAKRTNEQKQLAAESALLIRVYWDEVLAVLPPDVRAERDALKEQQRQIKAELPPPLSQAWAIENLEEKAVTYVLKRGDVHRKAGEANPAYLRVVAEIGNKPRSRVDLADWLTDPRHPLTARVYVNRLWQHHFGHGIVETTNDFGTRGSPPTHPALLDWLAVELMKPSIAVAGTNNTPWSLKRMHKLMVMSATYRQASHVRNPDAMAKDPDNHWLWKMNRTRLDAESLRDAILAVSGTLNPTVGGRSVKVPLEPEVYDLIFTEGEPDNLWPVTPDERQHTRRSLYLLRKRNVRLPLMEAFDQPDTLSSCAGRAVSTFAPQALILMNGPFTRTQSQRFAVNLLNQFGTDEARAIDALYWRAFGRAPRAEELATAQEFLKTQAAACRDRIAARKPAGIPVGLSATTDPAHASAFADLCLAIFNTNEFAYID
ncbi:MAG: DUF1549 and DUF1553 domain-containing protein [Bacteroidales bacterium]|nr:DUF1549 and DUF1553 domain-containing protein [Bacteroidales bacterium]